MAASAAEKAGRAYMDRLEAQAIVGGALTRNKKTGTPQVSIPAKYCRNGQAMRAVGRAQKAATGRTNIICADCYACTGKYTVPAVMSAQERRYQALMNPKWVAAMTLLILAEGTAYFRWHGSGDVQSLDHLCNIAEVARRTPEVRHWLPTKEYKIVTQYLKLFGPFPGNLNVQESMAMLADPATPYDGPRASVAVVAEVEIPWAYNCPAYRQGGECLDCRACWHPGVVAHRKHIVGMYATERDGKIVFKRPAKVEEKSA